MATKYHPSTVASGFVEAHVTLGLLRTFLGPYISNITTTTNISVTISKIFHSVPQIKTQLPPVSTLSAPCC